MTIYRRTRTSFIAGLVVAIRDQLRAAAKRRHQRLALNDLLAMDAARLDDLGLNHYDIVDAIEAQRTIDLEARREANATRKLALTADYPG
jgi:uncharacterized protein YjiS (DUF1127 family)